MRSNLGLTACLLILALAVSCAKPNTAPEANTTPHQGGRDGDEWVQLGQIVHERRGLFLLELEAADIVTRDEAGQRRDFGYFATARVLDILVGEAFEDSDEFYNGDRTERWDVGRVVSVAVGDYEQPCMDRDGPLGLGQHLVAAPSANTSLRKFRRDGTRVPAGGLIAHFACVDDRSVVHFEDHSGDPRMDEVADVPLGQVRGLAAVWRVSDAVARLSVRAACEGVQCALDEACFFGAGCAPLTFLAPQDWPGRGRFPVAGGEGTVGAEPDAGPRPAGP